MSTESMPQLFDALFDDAAMFPPGNASANRAVRDHLGHRAAWYADMVGPLLVPHTGWLEFCTAHEAIGSPEVDVVVIGTARRPDRIPAGLSVTGYEVPGTPELDLLAGSGSIAAELVDPGRPDSLLISVAMARGAGKRVVAKYRTGGTAREAFPSEVAVAGVIASAASHSVPLKFTAGLHRAVRHTDTATGFEHHGYLNLMVAVHAAHQGAELSSLTALVSERASDPLLETVHAWSSDDVACVRAAFVSFGCCGIQDPIRDAVALGLLTGELS